MPPFYPGPPDDVLHGLAPELPRRGLFQTEYRGRTLRESLGPEGPAHGAFRRGCIRSPRPSSHDRSVLV